jgi:hypothetical protein
MTRTRTQHHFPPRVVPGVILVLTLAASLVLAPATHASSRVAAVTTSSIAYRLSGQLGSTSLAGWVSGTEDSTGIITATLTLADPTTLAPVSENLNGMITGKGASAMVVLAVTPMSGSKGGAVWSMAGGATSTPGQWAGTITKGSTNAGAWLLTPQTSTLSINFGGKSGTTSKDTVAVSGLINVGVTASGWADGTYSSFDNSVTTVVHGWVNKGGDVEFTIPWGKGGKAGTVVLVGLQGKVKLTHQSWSGTFIGPNVGDTGTWIAQQ